MADIKIEKNPERGGYVLRANCVVPERIERVFDYFANAFNLEELTPRWLNFTVATPPPIVMREGVLIDYRLTLHGIPVRWQSEISAWEPHRRFVDQALRSPYRWWHHEHLFEEVEGGTRVTDIVQYGVPGGALIHFLAVKRDVQRIFEYRQQQLAAVFPNSGPGE
ncbi:SRPBCC family protein [Adhaeretor mobilis]|uniref:CDP-paratose 2-epimerase n=1 Tax=Adhaeretor mobilis TaxID=1930276 RepID=A0A517MSA2_9BACT|nr:SRPBCC family protein [Adhaeretor mobilis]QDS97756.1 hypothetical protein HG15A2_10230 [Adhaeretor mobilis]